MAKTPEQIRLTGLYLGTGRPVEGWYWNKFLNARIFMSKTKKIDLTEMFQEKQMASFLGRDEKIPAINVDGQLSMVVEPAIIGEKIPESPADELLAVGVTPIEGTETTNVRDIIDTRNLTTINGSITNSTERLAAELFLNGASTVTAQSGRTFTYDLGLNARGALDLSASKSVILDLQILVEDYEFKWGRTPVVEVGKNVYAAVMNEINAANGKNKRMDYRKENGVLILEQLDLIITKLKPAKKASDGTTIDHSNFANVYTPDVLVACFAGLTAVGSTGRGEMFMGQVWVDRNPADKETGESNIFGKSAPMPCITYVDMFDRYTITLPA